MLFVVVTSVGVVYDAGICDVVCIGVGVYEVGVVFIMYDVVRCADAGIDSVVVVIIMCVGVGGVVICVDWCVGSVDIVVVVVVVIVCAVVVIVIAIVVVLCCIICIHIYCVLSTL